MEARELTKKKHKKFFEGLVETRLHKIERVSSLKTIHACSKEHSKRASEIRADSRLRNKQFLSKKEGLLQQALDMQRDLKLKYQELLIAEGLDSINTNRAYANLAHIKTVVAQRKRRLLESRGSLAN